jgi:hypothetical protein
MESGSDTKCLKKAPAKPLCEVLSPHKGPCNKCSCPPKTCPKNTLQALINVLTKMSSME